MSNKLVCGLRYGIVTAVTVALVACADSKDDTNNIDNSTTPISISGVISAPGGSVAFQQPTMLQRLYAAVFGESAFAALPGTSVVSGATVHLIQINADGTQQGGDIATAISGTDGAFTLDAPANFTPSAAYALRVGSGAAQMDALVTGTADQDIDPAAKAATDLILATVGTGGDLSSLAVAQVASMQDAIATTANDVDSTATVADAVAALKAETQNQVEASNMLASITADGTITGTVKDASGNALTNVTIVVRDFKDWVTRAKTKTDASGQYTVKVPSGKDYILGALNHTGTSTAASEWWTTDGGAANLYSAGKITVADTTAVTKDFTLDDGGRIKGTVYATDGTTPLPGIVVLVRDFSNDTPVATVRTKVDGAFRINVRACATCEYTVGARNSTLQPYASVVYNGPAAGSATAVSGGLNATQATPVQVTAGQTYTAKFALPAGGKVGGFVTDPASGTDTAVTGISVRFYGNESDINNGAFVQAVRTNKNGGYRMWVTPGAYRVDARGQSAAVTPATSTPVSQNFNALVGQASGTAYAPDGLTPLSQLKVRVFDTSGNYQSFEASNGDGTFTVYTNNTGNYLLEYKVDNGSTSVGTMINGGGTQLLSGTAVAFTADSTAVTALGDITMPAGGELAGVVTVAGVPQPDAIVQVRSGGTAGSARFTATRTQSDGSYTISLPTSTSPYTRVCAFLPPNPGSTCPGTGSGSQSTTTFASEDSVAVAAGSNTLNLNLQ